jgi:putative Mg2+ transporter-C (MgtC) family protein
MFTIEIENLPVILLRLVIAFLAGAIIGWERETYLDLPISHRGSIFRLYALVCFGSCMFTIAGIFGFSTSYSISDKISAQVVSGVGFLGAGTILRDRQGIIRGLPTAAGIWVSASIGLIIGTGHYISGLVGTGFAYIIMILPHRFPRLFLGRKLKKDHIDTSE